jgi:spore maturation protein CgeB
MKVLRIVLDGEEYPHFTLTTAFEKHFEHVETIWRQRFSIPRLNETILSKISLNKYDVIFMQIQQEGVIYKETARKMSEKCLVFNWTGDVRSDISWYEDIGEYVVTLFTNNTDVEKMRAKGYRSDFLQIGFDHKYYYPPQDDSNRIQNIVMCANYYPELQFPLTQLRVEAVNKLKIHFPEYFNLYGGSKWKDISLHPECYANNEGESDVYRRCGIAVSISHFDYKNYFSDRLLREMACGAFVLSHRYQNCEEDFIDKKHLVFFDDIDDLFDRFG